MRVNKKMLHRNGEAPLRLKIISASAIFWLAVAIVDKIAFFRWEKFVNREVDAVK